MQHSKTGNFIETVIEWRSEHVVANVRLRPYMQMILTFQIHPGTIKLIQRDNITEANISGNRICSLTTNYSQDLPTPWLFSLLVTTDVYSRSFKYNISCIKLIF
jgi:hypothetical protein